jgi:hypothetical protein
VELIRYRNDVWGEEVILGVSWDLLWVVSVTAFVLLAVNTALRGSLPLA